MTVPGVQLNVQSTRTSPRSVGRYDAVYTLVYSASNNDETPFFVKSLAEFTARYGASASSAPIDLFFKQNSGYGLYCIGVRAKATRALTVPTITNGATYSLTIDGQTFSTLGATGDTQTTILARLALDINTSYSAVAVIRGTTLVSNATTVTGVGVNVGASVAAASFPTPDDCLATLTDLAFSLPQGLIAAPEFFSTYTDSDRILLQGYLEAFCRAPERRWSYIVDPKLADATGTNWVNKARTDRARFTSPDGLGSYEYPWLINSNNVSVQPSLVKAALTLKRWRLEGFTQPGAGDSYPVTGVIGTTVAVEDPEQRILNPLGINCFRGLPWVAGVYSWGSRTMSTDPNWTWTTTVVIVNSLAKRLESVVRPLTFNTRTTSRGSLMTTAYASIMATCEEYRRVGALWGDTLADAVSVTMDDTNNSPTSVDSGTLNIDVRVKPAPLIEYIQLNVTRVPLGLSFTDFVSSLGTVQQPTQATQGTGAVANGTTSP